MQVQNRVAHELAGRVQGDVSASPRRDQGDAGLRKRRLGGQQVIERRPTTERDRRFVFDEQHRVGNLPGLARLLQLVLQRMHRLIGSAPQPKGSQ